MAHSTKRLPIGVSDFTTIIEQGYYYVDKTGLIKELEKSGTVTLLPRPRRFGKTLNLSMLQAFYEKKEHPTGHLFEGLEVWNSKEHRLLQGTYPAISLSFRSASFDTFEHLKEKVSSLIAQECARHNYLLSDAHLSPFEQRTLSQLCNGHASQVQLTESLEVLIKALHTYHKKKVIILVDEYDTPLQAAYVHGYYEKALDLLRPLFTSALKDNSRIEKAVLTGILTLAHAGIFSGLNNIDVYNLMHTKFASFFGFTESEADHLLSYYKLGKKRDIKNWYNGYTFGETTDIFNPWSLMKCIANKGALELYWSHTSDNTLIKELLRTASADMSTNLRLLLEGKSIQKPIEESLVLKDIHAQQDALWSLLLFSGYVTYSGYSLKEEKKHATLAIPNEEIRFLYRDLIRSIFKESLGLSHTHELVHALSQGNAESVERLLTRFIEHSMSYHDVSRSEPEQSYHLFMLGLLVIISDTHFVRSNRESGFGRYEILLLPQKPTLPAIIIELKKSPRSSHEALKGAAKKALQQIHTNRYDQEPSEHGISTVLAFGIAFHGKQVAVVAEPIPYTS